ncbi:hypothetical protein COT44_02100 [Candidatus Shapirobacteria bacterium CG08_land_8_20_14_0_20_39_18]|uniref:NodB homology domain-containing protein n=1 Tax=Candidatus Shapirobacteria bacterium CG08_land_8_20_14_0_20_39_18 TaxID=1974883 RepID=A0A2M6XDB5_9BACT|nr:MAG: hypothetical protein COT44_02100 [Candidatus Shapirobacteria bacterium CG08_land_8_20_14_0_20_39_18]PIY66033.1 MAG: hypothetical protein COY91_01000 [Candidatus Shapirobacteria bacterium CG_4_10_14_0_8_um_filter_39_15]PJE68180.1 MAG: hypothetical protein COU94_03255 [Candidatus Shapirobacteria bacterium CG10_big_fil_rev_8_21_14_0_10_38_8]
MRKKDYTLFVKPYQKILFFLFLISLGLVIGILVRSKNSYPSTNPIETGQPVATQSAFSTAVEEAQKKEEEKQRQQEETKKFIATYGPCRFVPVLMYHHVANKSGSLYVRPDIFASQMNYLNQKGYTSVTLSDVMESLISGKPLPAKPVIITFDDGYKDIYQNAYGVLNFNNQKATLFIITQLLGGSDYLNWEELREMAGNPLITVGDHTLSHRSLTLITAAEVKNEIVSAKSILEANLGVTVNTFAYPYGTFNGEAEQILSQSGFAAAVTTHYGLTCAKLPFEIPRVRVGNSQLSAYGL